MSAALINRSLTTIRTELEFLHDSEVIDQALYDRLTSSLPQKYSKDMSPWGVDKISVSNHGESSNNDKPSSSVDAVSNSLAMVTVQDKISPPRDPPSVPVPPRSLAPAIGYCKASYDYDAQELGDLALQKDDRIAVVEHLSPDWWKGYKVRDPSVVGVFPSNYVSVISEQEFKNLTRPTAAPSEKASYDSGKFNLYSSGPPAYETSSPGPNYGGYQVQQGQPMPQMQMQPTMQMQPQMGSPYGYNNQYPPANYYPPQQQQQPQQQQLAPPQEAQQHHTGGLSGMNEHAKKFGKKMGNAAIFGAGATIGSNIVNLIF